MYEADDGGNKGHVNDVLSRKPMVPGGRPLIAIGYKYNARKVISFIVTDNAGSTKTGIPYYPSILTNLLMFPFTLLLVPLLFKTNLL